MNDMPPCPVCSKIPELQHSPFAKYWWVKCNECNISTSMGGHSREAKALWKKLIKQTECQAK